MLRAILTIFLCALGLAVAAETDVPHVSVYGTATTKVVPDLMNWRLTVRNVAPTASAAAKEHAEAVKQVLALVERYGAEDTQTARMEFGENWEYRNDTRVREGYYAWTAVTFRSADLDAYQPLWIGLAGISGVQLEDIAYDHSERIQLQEETRREALLVAKEKAADLAQTLGSDIGEPLWIAEEQPDQPRSVMFANTIATSNDQGPERSSLAEGKISITMRVHVAFRLIAPSE